MRLPNETAERLQAWARRTGRSLSEVGARSIEEWLRQHEFADIEFRGFGAMRDACLKGGPQVWVIILVAEGYAMDAEQTAAHFGWPVHRVQAAFNYYVAYPAEVDQAINDNRSVTFQQLQRLLPQVESWIVPRAGMDGEEPS